MSKIFELGQRRWVMDWADSQDAEELATLIGRCSPRPSTESVAATTRSRRCSFVVLKREGRPEALVRYRREGRRLKVLELAAAGSSRDALAEAVLHWLWSTAQSAGLSSVVVSVNEYSLWLQQLLRDQLHVKASAVVPPSSKDALDGCYLFEWPVSAASESLAAQKTAVGA